MADGKTSTTAYIVTTSISKLAQTPQWRGYVTPEAAALHSAFARLGCDTLIKRLIYHLPLSLAVRLMDTLFIPGMTHHFLFRKRYIEQQLEKAVQEGVAQVIMLGAGLDTLTLRAAGRYPSLTFFEIDLPQTQRAKTAMLERTTYRVPANCIFKPADLSRTELSEVLKSTGAFKPNVPTLVILEGVLMYLTEQEVRTLFSALRQLIQAPLTIVFGAMTFSDQASNWCVRMIDKCLSKGNEATKWHCASSAIPTFFRDLGYELEEWISYKDLQRQYRSEAEINHVPEEDENYYVVKIAPKTVT